MSQDYPASEISLAKEQIERIAVYIGLKKGNEAQMEIA